MAIRDMAAPGSLNKCCQNREKISLNVEFGSVPRDVLHFGIQPIFKKAVSWRQEVEAPERNYFQAPYVHFRL